MTNSRSTCKRQMKVRWLTIIIIMTAYCLLFVDSPLLPAKDCQTGARLYQEAMALSSLDRRIELLKQSRKECADFAVLYEMGKAHLDKGLPDEAEIWFKEALWLPQVKDVARSKALVALGSTYEQKGDVAAAITSYRQALTFQDYPKVRERILALEVERSKSVYAKDEIVRALVLKRSFKVEAGLNLPVQFDFDTATLNTYGQQQAVQLSEALADKQFAGKRIVLLGHTDQRGEDDYNLKLSKDRAEAVKAFVVRHSGLNALLISTEGLGKTQPLYQENSENAHRINRRVEVRVQ